LETFGGVFFSDLDPHILYDVGALYWHLFWVVAHPGKLLGNVFKKRIEKGQKTKGPIFFKLVQSSMTYFF
jgi:hypothetical protein